MAAHISRHLSNSKRTSCGIQFSSSGERPGWALGTTALRAASRKHSRTVPLVVALTRSSRLSSASFALHPTTVRFVGGNILVATKKRLMTPCDNRFRRRNAAPNLTKTTTSLIGGCSNCFLGSKNKRNDHHLPSPEQQLRCPSGMAPGISRVKIRKKSRHQVNCFAIPHRRFLKLERHTQTGTIQVAHVVRSRSAYNCTWRVNGVQIHQKTSNREASLHLTGRSLHRHHS